MASELSIITLYTLDSDFTHHCLQLETYSIGDWLFHIIMYSNVFAYMSNPTKLDIQHPFLLIACYAGDAGYLNFVTDYGAC